MFADDLVVISESTQIQQAKTYTQRFLHELEQYYDKWKLKANGDKTQNIPLTWKIINRSRPLAFCGQLTRDEDNIKYLGVHLDKRLLFRKHIEEVRRKAYAAKSFIKPYIQLTNPLTRKLKIQLYNAHVKSIMLYAAPIWSSAAHYNLRKLQTIENHCLRATIGKRPLEISNRELHITTEATPITQIIQEKSDKFFHVALRKSEATVNVATITPQNAPFRVKHKLITSTTRDS